MLLAYLSVSRRQNIPKNRSRPVAFSERPSLCSRWQCHVALLAHRFLLPRCPIQLPKLLIGLRAASFGTRQVKNREMSATVQMMPRGNAISYTRASGCYANTGQRERERERRVQPLETRRVSRKGVRTLRLRSVKGISVGRMPGKLKTERRTRCKRRRAVVSKHINAIQAHSLGDNRSKTPPFTEVTHSRADFREARLIETKFK